MFVLIGEMKGDYDDFYQRPCEVVAVSKSSAVLERHRDALTEHNYVDFRIEEAPEINGFVSTMSREEWLRNHPHTAGSPAYCNIAGAYCADEVQSTCEHCGSIPEEK